MAKDLFFAPKSESIMKRKKCEAGAVTVEITYILPTNLFGSEDRDTRMKMKN